mgnify:CR=1 FL=1
MIDAGRVHILAGLGMLCLAVLATPIAASTQTARG